VNTPEGPHLTLLDRRVAARPQGMARRLARASVVTLIASCAASLLLCMIYPQSSAMPQWLGLLLGFSYLGTAALSAVAALTQLWCWVAPRIRATVQTDGHALTVQRLRRRRIPLGDIAAGWLLRTADRGEVELALRSGDVLSVEVLDPAEADALLDAANVAPHERALTMRLGGPLVDLGLAAAALFPGGCLASIVAVTAERALHLPSVATGFLLFTLTALSVALSVAWLRPPVVRVGHDGLSVRGGRGAWFAPWGEITRVTRQGASLTLSLRGGAARVLSLTGTPRARQDALCARIAEALAEARAPRDLSTRLAALDRHGRTLEAWSEALRAIPTARDDYRQTGLSRDELLAALSDPHAPEERRVAAAFVLSSLDPAAASARVRVAVETLAHDPVRIALTHAAEGTLDDDLLRQAAETRVRVN
jgi:hypothetical protein